MSPLSDERLKRLKKFWEHKGAGSSCDCMTYDEAMALLARLEAAELCARYLDAIHEKHRSPMENQALNEWRKAAGK